VGGILYISRPFGEGFSFAKGNTTKPAECLFWRAFLFCKIRTMKNIEMPITEFMLFKALANQLMIIFDFTPVRKGKVTVTAQITDLEKIGY
jgi:hypothetical protein